MSFTNQNPEVYGMYPVSYTASPAELNKWDYQEADHGVYGADRTHLEMMHNAINNTERTQPVQQPNASDAYVMKFAGVEVRES